jgi:hypothetical protein
VSFGHIKNYDILSSFIPITIITRQRSTDRFQHTTMSHDSSNTREIRGFQVFKEFPWLNGIALTENTLMEKLEEMVQEKTTISESALMAIKVCCSQLHMLY